MNPETPVLTWRGPIVRCPASDAQRLSQAITDIPVSPYENLEEFLLRLRAPFEALPLWLRREVRALAVDPDSPPALPIRGLPIDENLPPTPADGRRPLAKQTFVGEAALLGISQMLGEPFGYHAEKEGAVLQNVIPLQGYEEVQSNSGSSTLFQMHVENCGAELRPDHFGLFCLRPDHDGAAGTLLAPVRDACRRLDPADVELLRQPLYRIATPDSFVAGLGDKSMGEPNPVLFGPDELPQCNLQLYDMEMLNDEAKAAYHRLAAALRHPEVLQVAYLQPGDLLLVDNRKALHGRTPFALRGDGKDRWLLRSYVRSQLWDRRSTPGAQRRVF